MKRIEFDETLINSLPKSLEEAKRLGSLHYSPSISCQKNHPPVRIVRDDACFFCKRERTKKSAEKRRIKLGIKPKNKVQPVPAGEVFEDLISTGRSKREIPPWQKRSRFYIEVKCKCGKLYWLDKVFWKVTPRCRHCTNKVIGITHGLAKSQQYQLFHSARKRALKSKIDFTIKLEDVIVPDVCPILGIDLDLTIRKEAGNKRPRENAPSLDRIDSRKGYIPGNVIVVSYRANVLKKDATSREHELVAEYLKSKQQNG
jgi:hypothetical protein